MKTYILKNYNNLQNLEILILKLTILFTPLILNKYVNYFRANQIAWLKLFSIIGITLCISKYLLTKKFIWKRSKLNLPIYLFILIMSFSIFKNNSIKISYRDYLIFLSYFILYFLIINNITIESTFHSFIRIFFISSSIIAFYTILHYYGFIPYLKEYGPVISPIGQKNWTSNYLTLIFPLMFSYFLLEENKKGKKIYFLFLSIIYAALMICQSRSIWISLGLTFFLGVYLIYRFGLLPFFYRNKKWLIVLLSTFLIITLIYSTENSLNKSPLTVTQRALSTFDEKDPSINTRFLIWKNTLQMIRDRPFLGGGLGDFGMNYLDYQAKFLQDNPQYIKYWTNAKEAHNEYLQIGTEMGLLGLGTFILIILIYYGLVIKYFKKESIDYQKEIDNIKNYDLLKEHKEVRLARYQLKDKQNQKLVKKEGIVSCLNSNELKLSPSESQDKNKIIIFGALIGISCFLIHSLFTFPLHVPALGSAFFIIIALTIVYMQDFNLTEWQKKKHRGKNVNKNEKGLKISRLTILYSILIFLIMIFVIDSVVIRPYLAEVYAFQGKENFINTNRREALSKFEHATLLDPYNGTILLNLGATYYNLGIYEDAIGVLKESRKYKNDRNIYRNLGLCYMKTKKYKEAEDKFKYVIYLDPNYTIAYFDLGSLYFLQKDYNKAIEQWEKALKIEPNFAENYVILANLGIVYNKKEMSDKALEYFVQALQLAPEGSPIIEEIEGEIYNIYKDRLNK